MHSCVFHALITEPFSIILFENKHNTWLIPVILLKHQCKSSSIQNYTKIKICVFIAVIYTCGKGLILNDLYLHQLKRNIVRMSNEATFLSKAVSVPGICILLSVSSITFGPWFRFF